MNAEFFEALNMLGKERGLSPEYLIAKIKAAIVIAVKKDYEVEDENVLVEIDPLNGRFSVNLVQDVVEEVEARGGITAGGRTYGCTSPVEEFITEEYYRSVWGRWNDAETLDQMVSGMDRTEDGLLADRAQLYGMERFALDRLTVLELSLIHI